MLHYFDTDFIRFHSKLWDLCFPSGLWQDLPEKCDYEMRPRLLSAILYVQISTCYHLFRTCMKVSVFGKREGTSCSTCFQSCNFFHHHLVHGIFQYWITRHQIIINLLDQIPQPLDYLPVPFMHNGCKWCATIIFSQCQLETVQILERRDGCEHQISERPLRLGRKLKGVCWPSLCWVSFGSPTIQNFG